MADLRRARSGELTYIRFMLYRVLGSGSCLVPPAGPTVGPPRSRLTVRSKAPQVGERRGCDCRLQARQRRRAPTHDACLLPSATCRSDSRPAALPPDGPLESAAGPGARGLRLSPAGPAEAEAGSRKPCGNLKKKKGGAWRRRRGRPCAWAVAWLLSPAAKWLRTSLGAI